ncbi:hypothetical protein CBQ28_04580 [Pseudoalteromonas sp. GCY]|uniref:Eco57I restriction-modification methylase domain-containing protein n=1 Tax=Pseudoalteromonas sp. GCY TaxID=2003316 RepID=UPI000BFEF782|nr:TaqI-like C-terminal specificity domain-containing protein [Pseudoalteromonas sp. GCY]PHI38361.1 hypothetical protein CBQ28_04580 [Pseudoalteromonas sp. GCY]QQQ65676.1 Eco57I restriction-modification methylase domain-containing protein [Pseudoalteromonas sp. GCY]
MLSTIQNNETHKASLAWGNSGAEKGEVFTKPEIVSFMLDTSGLSSALLIDGTRILEPSCGQGEFVIAIAKALVAQISNMDVSPTAVFEHTKSLIKAFDISLSNIYHAKDSVREILSQIFSFEQTSIIVESWFVNEDFLLSDTLPEYTFVIGNPPYVRIESIPSVLLKKYRNAFVTMKERADLYIAFYEKGLSSLKENGTLSYICTDRWVKNSYGSALRKFIADGFRLDMYIDLYGQSAFQSSVLTYPAITQISKRKLGETLIIHNPDINPELGEKVLRSLSDKSVVWPEAVKRKDVVNGSKPWLFGGADELALIHRLETMFPTIEEAGCKVYIGAATGNNKAYIVQNDLNIEACRKLPVIKAADIRKGVITHTSTSIINTYDENGVINLEKFPKLKEYLESFADELKVRHIAKNTPKHWFKTIDRVYPERAVAEKLLIPDIKSELTVVYDQGEYHPNNSIYYIISSLWDLKALKAVLISGVGQLFVERYSTRISGGNLRFQAQHLRRIRLPHWQDVPQEMRTQLVEVAEQDDIRAAKELVSVLYGLSEKEKQVLGC